MNRWIRLVAAVIAMIQIANLQYAWTLFVKPITADHGWTLSSVQWAFSLFIALETWAMPLTGFLIDRQGARTLMTIAGLLCGFGWAGIGTAESLVWLYFYYAIAGLGAAVVYCGSMGVALKWFPDCRGFAAGIIAAGFGSGSALFIPLVRYLISTQDYKAAFFYTGLIQGTLIILAAQFLGGTGVPVIHTAKPLQKATVRGNTQHFTSRQMLRTRQFYVLYAMMLMMGIGGLLATAQVAPVADAFGVGASALAISLTVNPIANGSGRLFWGMVSDRLGREQTMVIAFTLQSMSLLSVIVLGPVSPTFFIVSMGMVFFTWGEVYVLFPAALADFFGSRNGSSNYSFLYSTKGVASILAGGAAAVLFESSHSWAPAFYGSAALALTSALMAIGLKRMPLPEIPENVPLTNAATSPR